MSKFKLLKGFEPENTLDEWIELNVNEQGVRTLLFFIEGNVICRELTIPEYVPNEPVIDMLSEFVFEFSNAETYDNIIFHLSLLFQSFEMTR